MGLAGRVLVDEAETWMRAHGILKPGRYANLYIPCTELADAQHESNTLKLV